jgi:hypothetical protein
MHIEGIRAFAARISTRSARLAIAGCVLVAVPLVWTVRQSWLTDRALERAAAAEKSAAQARMDVEQSRAQIQAEGKPRKDPAVRRSRHDDAAEIARVKQLYEEIDNLSRIQDRVADELTVMRRFTARRAAAAAATARPAP